MKKIQTEVTVYEVGDLLDISSVRAIHHKPGLTRAQKGLVVRVHPGVKGYSYKLLTEEGNGFTMRADETGEERYLGHIDMAALFDKVVM